MSCKEVFFAAYLQSAHNCELYEKEKNSNGQTYLYLIPQP